MSIENKINKQTIKQIEKITGSKLTLGKLIYAIRESEGQTQVEFAEKIGCSKQHLCDIEHDRKRISPRLAASYAKTLGYSEEQFIRLALQDIIDRDGLKMVVEVTPKISHANRHSYA